MTTPLSSAVANGGLMATSWAAIFPVYRQNKKVSKATCFIIYYIFRVSISFINYQI
jgi:hypothetical protein